MRFVSSSVLVGPNWLALPPPEPPRQVEPLRRPTTTPLDPASPPSVGAVMVLAEAKTSLENLSGWETDAERTGKQGSVIGSTLFNRDA